MAHILTTPQQVFGQSIGGLAQDGGRIPIELFADQPLNLAPEDYPNGIWSGMTSQYNKNWAYWKGYILNQKTNKGFDLYPVKLNIVRSAVINHAAMMLGQYTDDKIADFGIKSIVKKPELREAAVENMAMFWAINNGDNLILEASLMAQIFGGTFFKVAWQPLRARWPIRVFTLDPRACFPVWDGDDYDRLVSIDVFHQIPRPTASVRYRVSLRNTELTATAEPDYVTVHEHWDEQEYFVKVDTEIAKYPNGNQQQGDNPFFDPVLGLPIIPYAYAPRLRAGDFFGDSLIPGLVGPQDEINNDLAHLREGLADAMHQQPWVKNRSKGTQDLETADRDEFIDLGMKQTGGDDPEIGRLDGAKLEQPIIDLVTTDLVRMAREHSNMPDVAYGHAERTIQSALTMRYMMWPAINVGLRYRKNFSTGLKRVHYLAHVMALATEKIANVGGGINLGIKPSPDIIEAILLGYKTYWPEILPDDRADKVNEVIQRLSQDIMSPESAIKYLDGEDGLEEELNAIDEHRKKVAEFAMQQAEDTASINAKYGNSNEGNSSGGVKKKKPPKDQTTKAQAVGGSKSSKSDKK